MMIKKNNSASPPSDPITSLEPFLENTRLATTLDQYLSWICNWLKNDPH